jgi:hypothetical protein
MMVLGRPVLIVPSCELFSFFEAVVGFADMHKLCNGRFWQRTSRINWNAVESLGDCIFSLSFIDRFMILLLFLL